MGVFPEFMGMETSMDKVRHSLVWALPDSLENNLEIMTQNEFWSSEPYYLSRTA